MEKQSSLKEQLRSSLSCTVNCGNSDGDTQYPKKHSNKPPQRSSPMKIYFAGPLFSAAEKSFNLQFSESLQQENPDFQMILPQLEAEKIISQPDFLSRMYQFCLQSIKDCDAVLAILEGADADSGTCIEMGYAFGIGKPIIGVRTDFRSSEDRGLNLMVSNICAKLFWEPGLAYNDLVRSVAEELINLVKGNC
jgi:nucleoside 2-deoxyribosyltransferase